MHTHAGQVEQRADRVSETGRGVGGAGLSGSALGNVGAETAPGHQRFVSRAQESINRAGQGLQGRSSLLGQTGNNISNTVAVNQRRFTGIDPNGPDARTGPAGPAPGMPSASGSGSGGRRRISRRARVPADDYLAAVAAGEIEWGQVPR